MKKITPFLWFVDRAEEALNFYLSLFPGSKIKHLRFFGAESPGRSGTVRYCLFELMGQEFLARDGGPDPSFTPAFCFTVNCATEAEADGLWGGLTYEGKVLPASAADPHFGSYGRLQDKFGVTWQINLLDAAQRIVPSFVFSGKLAGRAEEAMAFYIAAFQPARLIEIQRYGSGEQGREGTVKLGRFLLRDQEFLSMDSGSDPPYHFTPALACLAECETQTEMDVLWDRLSADGGHPGRAGRLQDKFGFFWIIVPSALAELLGGAETERIKRVRAALKGMGKIEIDELRRAYAGDPGME